MTRIRKADMSPDQLAAHRNMLLLRRDARRNALLLETENDRIQRLQASRNYQNERNRQLGINETDNDRKSTTSGIS
jgi:hypothetical protein